MHRSRGETLPPIGRGSGIPDAGCGPDGANVATPGRVPRRSRSLRVRLRSWRASGVRYTTPPRFRSRRARCSATAATSAAERPVSSPMFASRHRDAADSSGEASSASAAAAKSVPATTRSPPRTDTTARPRRTTNSVLASTPRSSNARPSAPRVVDAADGGERFEQCGFKMNPAVPIRRGDRQRAFEQCDGTRKVQLERFVCSTREPFDGLRVAGPSAERQLARRDVKHRCAGCGERPPRGGVEVMTNGRSDVVVYGVAHEIMPERQRFAFTREHRGIDCRAKVGCRLDDATPCDCPRDRSV